MERLFLQWSLQGLLLSPVALALWAGGAKLTKRYGARWVSRGWVVLTLLFLLPLGLLLPAKVAPVQLAAPAVLAQPVSRELLAKPQPAPDALAGEPAQGVAASASVLPYELLPNENMVHSGSAAGTAARPTFLKAPQLTLLQGAAAMWLFGALGFGGWQLLTYSLWKRRALRCSLPAGEAWQAALAAALMQQPVKRTPRLLASAAVRGPLVAGLWRPLLLVPEGYAPGEAGVLMLAHELAHIRRRDIGAKVLFLLVRTVHWYNPAAWLVAGQGGKALEAACDEAVVAGRTQSYRAAYADTLLQAVRCSNAPAFTTGFALTKRDMLRRFAQLLDAAPKRRGLAALAALALCGCALAGLVACGEAVPAEKEVLPTPAPIPTATPKPDWTGEENAWADLDFGLTGGWVDYEMFPDAPRAGKGQYRTLIGQLTGYAVPDKDGVVTFYTSRDEGKSFTTSEYDFTALAGSPTFKVPNYQMISERTGFVVLCPDDDKHQLYQTDADFIVCRTQDGGQSWQRMGRHSMPKDSDHGLWHLQCFLWLNESVGFFTPHTTYSEPDIWRTTDGGATWNRLELEYLTSFIPYADVPGVHTCSVWMDSLAPAPGTIVVNGYAAPNANSYKPFQMVSTDYGETWFVRDKYYAPFVAEGEVSAQESADYLAKLAAEWAFEPALTLPPEPTQQELIQLGQRAEQYMMTALTLPCERNAPIYTWVNSGYAAVMCPSRLFDTKAELHAARLRLFTPDYCSRLERQPGNLLLEQDGRLYARAVSRDDDVLQPLYQFGYIIKSPAPTIALTQEGSLLTLRCSAPDYVPSATALLRLARQPDGTLLIDDLTIVEDTL